jgi:phosphopantetheine adenylyltransferase
MSRFMGVFVAVAVMTLGATSLVLAHEGHDHKLMGTVTMAANDRVMLKDKDGKDVIVKVTKDTTVKAKPAMKVEQIKPGTRVVITAIEEKDKSMTAKAIEVGALVAATK